MSIRPYSTSWFEILVPVAYSTHVTANLARTGAVEIEMRPHQDDLMHLKDLSGDMSSYHELVKRYDRYWSRGSLHCTPFKLAPEKVLNNALERIAQWSQKADPTISEIQALDEERSNLKLCQRVFTQLQQSHTDLSLVIGAGPVLTSRILIWPVTGSVPINTARLTLETEIDEQLTQFVVLPVDSLDYLQHLLSDINGRLISLPNWLTGSFHDALQQLASRLAQVDELSQHSYTQLDALYDKYDLAETLGDIISLEWCMRHVGSLEPASGLFVWITGWTSDTKIQLQQSFIKEDIPALLHFPPPPSDVSIPQVLYNPWWSKPFEIFTRALGIPSSTEVDPSSALVLIVPLLFGYMFADVGQGLVLVMAGFYLKKRWSYAPLLIICGFSAFLFGFLFGSIFSREDILPALWIHPLDEPLLVLFVPLMFAVLLLGFGQLLEGLGALWRGKTSVWWRVDAGFLIFYLGFALSLLTAQLHQLMWLGMFWYLLGKFSLQPNLFGVLSAVGSLFEDGMRLLVNTVSFARVGAFCLAHAGLSSALSTLADATNSLLGCLLVMVVANLLVILLEGLVVSIQTTRLVLFEFFNRFLQGQGRVFKPLPLPPMLIKRRIS